MVDDVRNKILVEKYRPQKLDDYVHKDLDKIKNLLKNPKTLPHLLFVSKQPGTGKTTLMKMIAKTLGADYLIINSSDERGIDTIRDKIKKFVSTLSTNRDIPKFVLLDEADGLTKDAQDSLRNLMETYSSNARFILSVNSGNKIIEPLQSRCVLIDFTQPPKDKIYNRLKFICEQEKIKYDIEGLNKVIILFYPDIRSMIMIIQSLNDKGVTTETVKTPTELFDDIYSNIMSKKYLETRKFMIQNGIDYEQFLLYFFNKIHNETKLNKEQKTKIIYEIAEIEYRFKVGTDKDIIFSAGLLKILEVI